MSEQMTGIKTLYEHKQMVGQVEVTFSVNRIEASKAVAEVFGPEVAADVETEHRYMVTYYLGKHEGTLIFTADDEDAAIEKAREHMGDFTIRVVACERVS
jgi:hypothetical protein